MTSDKLLGTYLNDHLGGANAGVELAHRLRERMADQPEATVLAQLAEDIEADQHELRGLIKNLGQGGHPVKEAMGSMAAKAHKLAVGELFTGDQELSLLLECETLALGIEGKRAMWELMAALAPEHPQLTEVDFSRLVERAADQRDRIETVRRAVARRCFAAPD